MEKILGRYLTDGEIVHHRDKNRSNNDTSNLELKNNQAQHASEHKLGTKHMIELLCAKCGVKFQREMHQVNTKIKYGQKNFYCNRKCMGKP